MGSKGRRITRKCIIISCSALHMLPTISSLYTFLFCSSLLLNCSARDTITIKNLITDETEDTLVSAGKRFELGFFSTPKGRLSNTRYVGIWYYNVTPQTVVWVANRDHPLSGRHGVFAVTDDGNLQVLDEKGNSYWSTNLKSSSFLKTAKLMDSGNLVLSDDESGNTLWESFCNPTDTFLPGMKMNETLKLTSWNSSDDPATGNFKFQQDQDGENQYIIIQNKSIQYWKNGVSGEFITSDEMPIVIINFLSNFSLQNKSNPLLSNSTFSYSDTRLVMNSSGEIQYRLWDTVKGIWLSNWAEPQDRCSVLNACGDFGSCNSKNGLIWMCKCLPGFEPSSPGSWGSGDFSGGCNRKTPLCGEKNEKIDNFLRLKMMKVGKPDVTTNAKSQKECRDVCVSNCKCRAYSFDETQITRRKGLADRCWIWNEDLNNLWEEYSDGRDLYVRVAASDIESTARNCETCGANIIPYPLSTEPNCGEPMYNSFHCDKNTGQLSFKAASGTYRVISINPETQKFVIQARNGGNCEARNLKGTLQLNQSSPFYVDSNCSADPGIFRSDMPNKGRDELEISWYPPQEPTCTSSRDCKDWPDSSCNKTEEGMKRCLCNANFQWNSSSLNCTQVLRGGYYNKQSEGPSSRKMSKSLIIALAVTSVIVLTSLSCTIVYISYLWRRRVAQRREIRRNQALHFVDSERRIKDLIDSDQFKEEAKKDVDVPFFELESILAATNNFSDEKKLGKGGFGPVYKGEFPGGREIAVKRLSSVSGQGLEEFKNEVVLIAKLQHRNLVRLLGYCIEGEEKILLYEYMHNKSLDSFIFDRTLCMVLDWESRFNIILGIARGLLYLHQDSRLRIIHRDLKTSNILLDMGMNPKISDFGLARLFGGKQTQENTNRVVGTYGYMSPEYANYGVFSIKSDVFSFGVVVLEIVSGKKITGLYQYEEELSLLGYAWKLWNEDKALDLMDETVCETCNTNEFLKCINIGLLCVQEDPSDRPTMSNVVVILGRENATLPTPKQPAFIIRRGPSNTASSSSKPETGSNNELTITVEEGR